MHNAHRPTGGWDMLWDTLRQVVVLWILLFLLRAIWLWRPDASGHPLAVPFLEHLAYSGALEWVYWAPIALPALVLALLLGNRPVPRAIATTGFLIVSLIGLILLVVSLFDMETMRFTGGHVSASLMRTYDSPTGITENLRLLSSDPGGYRIGENLYGESTWVPLVLLGSHPKLAGHSAIDDRAASHVDIAPTILDLVGIDTPNAMMGHSLVKPAARGIEVVGFLAPEISYSRGPWRLFMSQPRRTRANGTEVFSTVADRLDLTRGFPPAADLDLLTRTATDRYNLMAWVYEQDRILPPSLILAHGPSHLR